MHPVLQVVQAIAVLLQWGDRQVPMPSQQPLRCLLLAQPVACLLGRQLQGLMCLQLWVCRRGMGGRPACSGVPLQRQGVGLQLGCRRRALHLLQSWERAAQEECLGQAAQEGGSRSVWLAEAPPEPRLWLALSWGCRRPWAC